MKRKFLANVSFLIALNLLIKPFSVFIDILVLGKVGAEAYGIYFALFGRVWIVILVNIPAGGGYFNN